MFHGGFWSAIQPTNLALEGAHSTLEFNQDGKDLAKDGKQVLEMTKLLVEKAQRCYEVQVNAGRRKVEYEVGQKGVVECGQLHLGKGLTLSSCPKLELRFPL